MFTCNCLDADVVVMAEINSGIKYYEESAIFYLCPLSYSRKNLLHVSFSAPCSTDSIFLIINEHIARPSPYKYETYFYMRRSHASYWEVIFHLLSLIWVQFNAIVRDRHNHSCRPRRVQILNRIRFLETGVAWRPKCGQNFFAKNNCFLC